MSPTSPEVPLAPDEMLRMRAEALRGQRWEQRRDAEWDDDWLRFVGDGPSTFVNQENPAFRRYIAAVSPDVILALLDERDALLARAVQAEEKVARVEALLPGHPSEVVSKYAIRAALREEPTTEEVDHE